MQLVLPLVPELVKNLCPDLILGFRPTNLAGNVLWCDAADTASIIDSGGAASLWNDKSGKGNNASQGISAEQPTTNSVTIGGKNALSFDGGDYLIIGQPANLNFIPGTDEFTFFSVINVDTSNIGTIIAKSGNLNRQYQYFVTGDTTRTRIGGVLGIFQTVVMTGSPVIVAIEVRTTGVELFINGASDGIDPIGTDTSNVDVLIGARRATDANTGFDFPLTGAIGELIVYNRALNNQMQQVFNYLSSKWSIPLA